MKCRQCKSRIDPRKYWQLAILDDPCFCSRECLREYLKTNQPKVDKYLETVMASEVRE